MPSIFGKIKSGSSKQKQQLLFLGLAIFMFILTVAITLYLFSFLVSSFNNVLSEAPKPNVPQGFDIQGFEKLNLIK